MLRGFRAVDRRSAAARSVLDWEKRVVAELGGALTEVQQVRLATAARTRLLLDHVDAHLLEPRTLFAKRGRLRKEIRPLLDLRQRMAEQLDRALTQLGAKPKDVPVLPDLADVIDSQVPRSRNGTRTR